METLTIGELKARFSEVLEKVRKGQRIAISYGRKRQKVAVIVPYSERFESEQRELGILKGKASFKVHPDFKMTDQELLDS